MGSTDHRNTCGDHSYLSGAVVTGVLIGAQLTYGKYRFQDHLWAGQAPTGSKHSHYFAVPRGGHVDGYLSLAETLRSGGSIREKRLEGGIKTDPQGGTTASFAQAFSRAPVCWLPLFCLVFPRARKINVSMSPQLLSGAARDFEGKS